jgi:hypothetical protein
LDDGACEKTTYGGFNMTQWTKEYPKANGYFCWRAHKDEVPEVIAVSRTGYILTHGDGEIYKAKNFGGEWWDSPIELPKE